MIKTTKRGKEIRSFIIQNIPDHPRNVVNITCGKYGVTRQAINRYIRDLIREGLIEAEGKTSQRKYSLRTLKTEAINFPLSGLEEDQVWRGRLFPILNVLSTNVIDIWQYVCTEMINNAVDHSGGNRLRMYIDMNALRTEILVQDDGVGIFRKIKKACHLEDERHAILELSKGKLTTDPDNHTGEGIFFTSRILDDFAILSGGVAFRHQFNRDEDWIMEREMPKTGTSVLMLLNNMSERTVQEIFDRFAADDEDYGFNKTVVPVRLARHGLEKLISRSQAKRLLARVDRFSTVILDFEDVDTIGQAFADEIFRVFVNNHPNTIILSVNGVPEVQRMIDRIREKAADL